MLRGRTMSESQPGGTPAASSQPEDTPASAIERLVRLVIGGRKDPLSPGVFHQISLMAFLAWVGLGADGLSSSCYGPEEAFVHLGDEKFLAFFLVIATAATVFIISASYSQIIELFPTGGGGYLVATKLLGPLPGVVSGCALVFDYVLTIAISIASGADAIFSFVPPAWQGLKLAAAIAAVGTLIVLNLRGVKESVTVLVPIFVGFVISHAIVILVVLFGYATSLPAVAVSAVTDTGAEINRPRLHGGGAGVHARLQPGRRHLHRHRGGVERPPDPARAARADRQAHDALHGGLARVHGGRHPALVLAARHPASARSHAERHLDRSRRGRLDARRLRGRPRVLSVRARERGRAALRRRAGRLSRRAARARQHGRRLVGAAPLLPAQRPPRDPERHRAHGIGGARGADLHRRPRRPAGRPLQHQRLPHLHAVAARHVRALVAGARPRPLHGASVSR